MGSAQAEARIGRFGPHHRLRVLLTRLARKPPADSPVRETMDAGTRGTVENDASGPLPDPLLQAKAEDGQKP